MSSVEISNRAQAIGLFGVPFDPMLSEEALVIKRKYLQAKAQGRAGHTGFEDPYCVFSRGLSRLAPGKYRLHGEVPVPTWLRPKPQSSDAGRLTLDELKTFVKSGGCLTIARDVNEFIRNNIFPEIPGMIGVDHSSTYGAITALKEYYGGEEIGLVVLDSHFDAVPMGLRHGLIEYARETNIPSISPDSFSQGSFPDFSSEGIREWEQLNAENFLLRILGDKLIEPKNLVVIGLSDYPGKAFEEIDDPRVKDYLQYFKKLESAGTCLIPKSSLIENGRELVEKAIKDLSARKVYISLDIDICSLSAVYACRFLNAKGLSLVQIREVLQTLFSSFNEGLSLVGFDIMEIDIHKLGAKIDNSHADQTDEVIKLFLKSVGRAV